MIIQTACFVAAVLTVSASTERQMPYATTIFDGKTYYPTTDDVWSGVFTTVGGDSSSMFTTAFADYFLCGLTGHYPTSLNGLEDIVALYAKFCNKNNPSDS